MKSSFYEYWQIHCKNKEMHDIFQDNMLFLEKAKMVVHMESPTETTLERFAQDQQLQLLEILF